MRKRAPFSRAMSVLVLGMALTSIPAQGCWDTFAKFLKLFTVERAPFYKIVAPLSDGSEAFLNSLKWETHRSRKGHIHLGIQNYLLEDGSRPVISFVGRSNGTSTFRFYYREDGHEELQVRMTELASTVGGGLEFVPATPLTYGWFVYEMKAGSQVQIPQLLDVSMRFVEYLDKKGAPTDTPTPVPFPVIDLNSNPIQSRETGNPWQTPGEY